MIKNRGYPAESHFIKTKDDYILCVYRIPCKTCLDSNSFGHTPVMLFVHGILASAPSFLLPTDYAAGKVVLYLITTVLKTFLDDTQLFLIIKILSSNRLLLSQCRL